MQTDEKNPADKIVGSSDLLECANWLRRLAEEQRSFADTLYGGGTVAKALQANCLLSAKKYERWADAIEHSNRNS